MLWADKHRPTQFEDLTLAHEATEQLKNLVTPKVEGGDSDIPHILFYGPPGSGKKTRIGCTLHALYGRTALNMHTENLSFTHNSTSIAVPALASSVHHEINAASAGRKDRFVVQELITSLAHAAPIGGQRQPYRVVVLHDADRLSPDAQAALRRTMEQHSGACRIFLVASNLSGVAAPLRSRCFCVRLPAPAPAQITDVVGDVLSAENIRCSDANLAKIVEAAHGDLRRALLAVEATWVTSCSREGASDQSAQRTLLEHLSPERMHVVVPEWEAYADEVASAVLAGGAPADVILGARQHYYELLSKAIPHEMLFERLRSGVLAGVTDFRAAAAVAAACQLYETRAAAGQHPIMHLEALVAQMLLALHASA